MKKATTDSTAKENQKKKQRTSNLGEHGFFHFKVVDGKTHRREVTGGPPLENVHCVGCNRSFKTE